MTNPLFGVHMASSMDLLPFYRRVLEQLQDLLRPGGTVVMLVLREGPFNTAIRETEAFTIRHVRVIEIGGLYSRVFVLVVHSEAYRNEKAAAPERDCGHGGEDTPSLEGKSSRNHEALIVLRSISVDIEDVG